MVQIVNPMRILVRLVQNWNFIQIISRFCATLSALGCTGWRKLTGCLKSQVIFRKRATNSRALLLKMTYEDKASYNSTPLCSCIYEYTMHLKMHLRIQLNMHLIMRNPLWKYPTSLQTIGVYMGWLRWVGSMKLHVSLAEYSLFYRALLQNRRIIWSILLTEATP